MSFSRALVAVPALVLCACTTSAPAATTTPTTSPSPTVQIVSKSIADGLLTIKLESTLSETLSTVQLDEEVLTDIDMHTGCNVSAIATFSDASANVFPVGLFYQCPLDTTLSGTEVFTATDMKVVYVGAAENPYGLPQNELDTFVALNNELNNATNYSK